MSDWTVGMLNCCFVDFQWHEFLTMGVTVCQTRLLAHLITVFSIFSDMAVTVK